jgi:hypothetical protein
LARESAYYTWLLESLPGGDYNRTKLVEIVNDVQNEILGGYDGRLMKIKPDPYLVVTDSTVKRYGIDDLVSSIDGVTTYDIRRVKRLYSFTTKNQPFGSYNGFGNGLQPFPPIQKNPMVPEVEMPIQTQDSVKPLLEDFILDFHRNFSPSISTDLYNAEAWRWPNQITSENIQIEFPTSFKKTILLFGVLSKIETRDFGRDDTIATKLASAKADWLKYDEEGGADFTILKTPPRWA